mmetsp:Transcript_34510/g.33706  ORF Transcript_34510/g.33706 Transcript_34510/m.33706 type:complete len:135 (+) Transcript_34510:36-440(+)|eukprot:CAMPEP_0170541368 /NCGR_PEP_ID=MMETSP0211-20121228/1120_1 /TAXON_ID=311385 /ORGANISM="Pseudokeronopsis sp., Strain OXSARD2" /LENGTH=134 /DNA_ID=CAMNT_0010844069 /DNA_START=9 /DNA_END=413 /DNA_ORIENTATION=-
MGVQSMNKTKIIKKQKKHPNRFQSDKYLRVPKSWRFPHGIDSRIRRRFKGNQMEPKIGSKSAKKTRHMLKGGFKKFLLRNPSDIELLLMNNRTFAGEIAQCISARKRKLIVQRAKEMNVRLTNGQGKMKKQSAE